MDLSEGKSTGVPTIQEELRNNGSPKAKFYTDEDRRAVTVEIPIHPDFNEEKVDIQEEKVDIETLKKKYFEILKNDGSNRATIENVNKLLVELDINQVFGRNEIISILKMAPSSASKFIIRLKNAGIIERVTGKGKGKYIFNISEIEDYCNDHQCK